MFPSKLSIGKSPENWISGHLGVGSLTYWRCLVQNFQAMICQLPTAPRCLKGRVKHSRWIPTKCPAPSNSQQATQGNQVESSMHLTMSSLGLGRSQAPDRKQVWVVLLTCVFLSLGAHSFQSLAVTLKNVQKDKAINGIYGFNYYGR